MCQGCHDLEIIFSLGNHIIIIILVLFWVILGRMKIESKRYHSHKYRDSFHNLRLRIISMCYFLQQQHFKPSNPQAVIWSFTILCLSGPGGNKFHLPKLFSPNILSETKLLFIKVSDRPAFLLPYLKWNHFKNAVPINHIMVWCVVFFYFNTAALFFKSFMTYYLVLQVFCI